MSWIFSKAMLENLPSSLESEGGFLEDTSSDGKQSVQLSVTCSEHQFWYKGKTTDFSRLSRFGLTYRVLTEQDGEDLLTLYLEGFRARTSALQIHREKVLKDQNLECGLKCYESSEKLSQHSSSSKTLETSDPGGLPLFSMVCRAQDTVLSMETFSHQTVEHPIPGKEHSFLDGGKGRGWCNQMTEKEKRYVEFVASKTASEIIRSVIEEGRLQRKVKAGNWSRGIGRLLPTMTVADSKNNASISTYQRNSLQLNTLLGGSLNPTYCDWLQGLPPGWTDLKPLEISKFQQWQHSHSHRS